MNLRYHGNSKKVLGQPEEHQQGREGERARMFTYQSRLVKKPMAQRNTKKTLCFTKKYTMNLGSFMALY